VFGAENAHHFALAFGFYVVDDLGADVAAGIAKYECFMSALGTQSPANTLGNDVLAREAVFAIAINTPANGVWRFSHGEEAGLTNSLSEQLQVN
jgi:hypothetical protein